MGIDFQRLESELDAWYRRRDQRAAAAAYQRMYPAVRSTVRKAYAVEFRKRRLRVSWAQPEDIEEDTQLVLAHLMAPGKGLLANAQRSFSGLFWTAAKHRARDAAEHRAVRVQTAPPVAHEGQRDDDEPDEPTASVPAAAPTPERRAAGRERIRWLETQLLRLKPQQCLAVLADAVDYGIDPDDFASARRTAAAALGRDDAQLLAALARARSGDPQAKADVVLGPGGKINSAQKHLSRARKALKALLEEES